MTEKKAGTKIASQLLFEQQKHKITPTVPVIIADNPKTPANIGSIFRLADATGSERIIFLQDKINTFDQDKTIRRISRNTTNNIDTNYWTYEQYFEQYTSLPCLIAIELTTTASNVLTSKLPSDCSFVIGSERHGLSDTVLDTCDSAIKIPMFGQNGSMNVSHALAICLYEWHRQHSFTAQTLPPGE